MANTSGATVIFLQSHPAWIAAQRRERERSESMRRHPSARKSPAAVLPDRALAAGSRPFKVYSSGDTPA